MRTVAVKLIYDVTQISSVNSACWTRLGEMVKDIKEDILFDFKGILLDKPWKNDEFKRFMSNEHVYLRIYNAVKERETIETMLMLEGLKSGRVENESIVKHYESRDEIRLRSIIERYKQNFVTIGDVREIPLHTIVDQIGSYSTVEAVINAIRQDSKDTGFKKYSINIDRIQIQENLLGRMANIPNNMREENIEVYITSNDPDTNNMLLTYQLVNADEVMSIEKRYKYIKNNLKPNTVGMLARFKETRRKDLFGRCGDGEPVTCRPAIFLGFTKKDGKLLAVFQEFRVNTFIRKVSYTLNNDGEKHPGLKSQKVAMTLDKLGIYTAFVGALYQFSKPIQVEESDYIYDYVENDRGGYDVAKICLPQHIKNVLSDFGVKFRVEELDEAIKETEETLK